MAKKKHSANFVYQDLRRRNGLKSTRGAERAKREAKIKRNDKWRKANGVITKGQAARRVKLAKEMSQERSLAESKFDEDAEYPVFSRGFDRDALTLLLTDQPQDAAVRKRPALRADMTSVELSELLQREFGHAEFRAGQEAAVTAVLKGERTLVILPTGQGKSLCYQLPALLAGGMTLVVSPLIALMSDQLKQLPACLRGAALHSEMSQTQFSHVMTAVKADLVDVVFAAPERLLMFNFQELFRDKIALVCVDEAHCLSEWSHSFRPSYLRLKQVIDTEIKAPRLLALTATASHNTVAEMTNLLNLTTVIRHDGIVHGSCVAVGSSAGVMRGNLVVQASTTVHALVDLLSLLEKPLWRAKRSVIVYVPYQWQTEQTARVLSQQGYGPAEPYHAGLLSTDRAAVQRRFIDNASRVVVATVAFSMGIDKADVDGVIHLEMPRSIEQFVQETGRAGRDGRVAHCHCLFSEEEFARMRRIIFSSTVDKRGLLMLLTWILGKDENWRQAATLDTWLEADGGYVSSVEIRACTRKLNCTSEQLEGTITTIEKHSNNTVRGFLNFPRVAKLRFFRRTLEELADDNDNAFFRALLASPVSDTASHVRPNSGVYTIDVLKAALTLKINPPTFMRALTEHARDSFAIEKRDWAHFVFVSGATAPGALIAKLLSVIVANSENFQKEQLRKIDSVFALMNRIALAPSEVLTAHNLVQQYFQGLPLSGLINDNELISQGIARASGHGSAFGSDSPSDEAAAYPWVRSEVLNLMSELATDSPTTLTKFLHALPSPNFATKDWKSHRAWGAWTQLPFEVLLSLVSTAVNELGNGAISRN